MIGPRNLPAGLAVALAIALLVTGGWAVSVSESSLGAYNPAWDGTSELRPKMATAEASS